MGVASSFQAAFCGRVEQDEFVQQVDFEWAVVNNVSIRSLVTRRSKTQTFVFTGLSETDANTTTSQTVTDRGGTSYTVPMAASFTDGSTGTKVFEKESVQVARRKLSPALWEVVVKRTGSAYYVNGSQIIPGPAWM